jgi:arylsulfatase
VTPDIRGRSYVIAAEVDIDTGDASGVLFSQGSRFGGHALYVKDGKLVYAYNFVGEAVQVVESTEPVPAGHVTLSASFEREGNTMPPRGTLSLHMRERQVGEGTIMTQPGKFGLGGGGLAVGRSGAEPVADDYPGQRPWAFTGGTVRRVVIDVSGQPFADLAREAAAAYARQ